MSNVSCLLGALDKGSDDPIIGKNTLNTLIRCIRTVRCAALRGPRCALVAVASAGGAMILTMLLTEGF